MLFLLLAIFLKGPAWLKVFILMSFGALFLVAIALAASTFRTANERTAPAHVTRGHQHATRLVRS